jgi:hypothetical protein
MITMEFPRGNCKIILGHGYRLNCWENLILEKMEISVILLCMCVLVFLFNKDCVFLFSSGIMFFLSN